MATNVGRKPDSRPPTASLSYPTAPPNLQVPRTPLESRQGYHPKTDDRLKWKTPPSRQLSRQKRVEYESDVRERFYDDYLGTRSTGDARNEVLTTTELAKLKFDPNHYRVNAYQGLAYDPMRQVPAGLDFNVALQQERMRERQRKFQESRQRRLSDPSIGLGAPNYYPDQYSPPEQRHYHGSGPPILPPIETPSSRSGMAYLDETVNPELVPAVESWLQTASKKDQQVAADFFRTMSSQGRRPDPAAKASVHRTRVRSAVITPTRKQRQEQQTTRNTFQQLSRDMAMMDQQAARSVRKGEPSQRHRLQRSNSEKGATKGSMFTANKQLPSHFTVHPEWASEATSHTKKSKKIK